MARPPTGPALVHRLQGSDDAKMKTEIILSTLTGARTIEEAAAALGMDRSYVFVLRDQILEGAVAAAEPRTPGPKPVATQDPEMATLRAELAAARKDAKDLEIALELERCRVEVAAVLGPRLKKTTAATTTRPPRR